MESRNKNIVNAAIIRWGIFIMRHKFRVALLPALAWVLIALSCTEEQEDTALDEVFFVQELSIPGVEITSAATNITHSGAEFNCTITKRGGADITSRGLCWSETPNPTVDNNITYDGAGTGDFAGQISGCKNNTKYYVRAYAVNSQGVGYSNEISFKTLVKPTHGTALFWMSNNPTYWVQVYVDGVDCGYISIYYPSSYPDCGTEGCVTVENLLEGTHTYSASNIYYNWSGTINIIAGECNKMQLTIGK